MAKNAPVKVQPSAPRPPTLKVRATQLGYYDHVRRRVGDVFTLHSDRHFSQKWMEYVDADMPERTTTPLQDLRRQHDEILRERTPASGTPLVDDALPTGARNPLDV